MPRPCPPCVAHQIILALLTLGAVAQLARLVVVDTITAPVPATVDRRAAASAARRWLTGLSGCSRSALSGSPLHSSRALGLS